MVPRLITITGGTNVYGEEFGKLVSALFLISILMRISQFPTKPKPAVYAFKLIHELDA